MYQTSTQFASSYCPYHFRKISTTSQGKLIAKAGKSNPIITPTMRAEIYPSSRETVVSFISESSNAFLKKIQKRFLNYLSVVILVLLTSGVSWGQVPMASTGSYSQSFTTLISTSVSPWVDNSTIANWYSQRTGTG